MYLKLSSGIIKLDVGTWMATGMGVLSWCTLDASWRYLGAAVKAVIGWVHTYDWVVCFFRWGMGVGWVRFLFCWKQFIVLSRYLIFCGIEFNACSGYKIFGMSTLSHTLADLCPGSLVIKTPWTHTFCDIQVDTSFLSPFLGLMVLFSYQCAWLITSLNSPCSVSMHVCGNSIWSWPCPCNTQRPPCTGMYYYWHHVPWFTVLSHPLAAPSSCSVVSQVPLPQITFCIPM